MPKVLVIGSVAESLITFRGHLLRRMADLGLEVVACSAPPDKDTPENSFTGLKACGVRFCEIPFNRSGLNPIHDLKTLFSIVRLLHNEKPDLVLAYTVKPVIYGAIASFMTRISFNASIITGLGYVFINRSAKGKILNFLVRKLYYIALSVNKKVFFQNPDDLNLFRSIGIVKDQSNPTLINGSGVDVNQFSPAPFPNRFTYLMISRIIDDKGVREYVAAARKLKKSHPDVRFRLVGFIDDNPSAIKQWELDEWVREGVIEFLGRLYDVRPAIADASVYVLPSYREGTPRSVLEAMAMGRPVITSDAPGCRETVSDGVNGFLVPVRDVDALVGTMEIFIRKPDLVAAMGTASRRIAVEKYDVEKVNTVILENLGLIYEESI